MACFHPRWAFRGAGGVTLREPLDRTGFVPLRIPCGGCVGCRLDQGRAWAIRCSLELQQHTAACWATLTYSDATIPWLNSSTTTLDKTHFSAYVKRLRARHPEKRIRFFGCGEYGERTQRPHYHIILYGIGEHPSIADSWGLGHVRIDPLTPAAISYVAGYCAKKAGYRHDRSESVDSETGEVVTPVAPFRLMSRRPGIGGDSRAFAKSWRKTAVWNGREVPVPRYLHAAWVAGATPDQLAALQAERDASASFDLYDRDRRAAAEQIAMRRLELSQEKQKL